MYFISRGSETRMRMDFRAQDVELTSKLFRKSRMDARWVTGCGISFRNPEVLDTPELLISTAYGLSKRQKHICKMRFSMPICEKYHIIFIKR